jgi:hypothetical protein
MITGAEITFGFQALKTALGLAKEAKDLTDTTAIKAKVIEMQGLILEAQADAIEAREAHTAQIDRIRELEADVTRFKTWETEKNRYELKEIFPGSFAYLVKESMRGTEPLHQICATCYQQDKKAILQKSSAVHLQCPVCESAVQFKELKMPNFG